MWCECASFRGNSDIILSSFAQNLFIMRNHLLTLLFLGISIALGAQTWQILPTQNACSARHENAMAAIGNRVYLLGGRGMRPVDELNLSTNTWKALETSPLEMNHFQALSYKGEIYVLGAFTGKYPHEMPIEHIYIFNPKTNAWRKGPEIPKDRLRGAAGTFIRNNKFYIVCGIQDGHWDGFVGWFDEYDPATNTWRKLPDAPHARDHISVAVVKDKLVVAGGRTSWAKTNQVLQLTLNEVDIYDFKTNTWTTLDASKNIPTPRAGATAIAYKGKVLIIGGESSAHVEAHNEVEAFDVQKNTWEKWPNLHTTRHGTQVVKAKGKLYIGAGSKNRGGGPELNTVEVLR